MSGRNDFITQFARHRLRRDNAHVWKRPDPVRKPRPKRSPLNPADDAALALKKAVHVGDPAPVTLPRIVLRDVDWGNE